MKLPFIIIIDDDIQVLRALQRDVNKQYAKHYRTAAIPSGAEALELISELKLTSEDVALLISDQRMPGMDGVTFLEKAKAIYPAAKLILLTAYSDINVAIKAINDIRLDYYLLKPWSPAEEKLYPVVDDLLDDWHAISKPLPDSIRILGFQWSPKSHALKEFLSGNLVPYLWIDGEQDEADQYLASANVDRSQLPLVILKDGEILVHPSIENVASRLGLKRISTEKMYDMVVIGAGPSGLAASLYGSSEGLKTLLVEKNNPGGQASSSARIENYLGFPSGLSGGELTRRAVAQTIRFGTEILTPQEVKRIRVQDGYKILEMADGQEVFSKSIVISTGVAYRQLDVPGVDRFSGAGIYYGSAAVEAQACKDQVIYIIGGGNSACQAAMYMSKFAKEVNILLRGERLNQVAANYLVQQISEVPAIRIVPNTEILAVHGAEVLESITLQDNKSGAERIAPAKAVFVYIGAKPSTEWLEGFLLRDEKGFILTGTDLLKQTNFNSTWTLERPPYLPEASVPGVFVSGDVRSGALAGISSAVGEGALATRFVRKYLQEM